MCPSPPLNTSINRARLQLGAGIHRLDLNGVAGVGQGLEGQNNHALACISGGLQPIVQASNHLRLVAVNGDGGHRLAVHPADVAQDLQCGLG